MVRGRRAAVNEVIHVDFPIQRISYISAVPVEAEACCQIVDILLEFPDRYDMEDASARLQKAGWIVMKDDSESRTLDLNKGYTPEGFAERWSHLHVRSNT